MIYKFPLLNCLVLLLTAQSMATTLSVHELFQPATKQTVILANDCHFKEHVQLETWLNAIAKYKAYPIVEAASVTIEKNETLLSMLGYELRMQKTEHFDPDFRTSLHYFMSIFMHSLQLKYPEVKEYWSRDDVKLSLAELIFQQHRQSMDILIESKSFITDLYDNKELNYDNAQILYEELNEIGCIYNEVKGILDSLISKLEKSTKDSAEVIATYMFNDIFIPQANEHFTLNKSSLHLKLFGIMNKLMDMRILLRILQKKNESIIVLAGIEHNANLMRMLIKLGYQVHAEDKDDWKMVDKCFRKLEEDHVSVTDLLEQSYEHYKLNTKLDIDTFLADCATLTQ